MRQHQDAAEAAGLGPVVLQHPQRVVGRADGAASASVDLLDARHADSGAALGIDRIRIELPLLKPGADVLDRLLARLGDMERRHDAKVGAIHDAALCCRLGVGQLPIVVECVVAVRAASHHAQHAEVIAPGELAAIRRHRAGDGQVRSRLRIRA